MSETKIEPYYKKQAQNFIDVLFDKGYFRPEVKRQDMRNLDKFLGFILQSQVNMAVQASELLRNVSK